MKRQRKNIFSFVSWILIRMNIVSFRSRLVAKIEYSTFAEASAWSYMHNNAGQ